jgi:hypothetical protein
MPRRTGESVVGMDPRHARAAAARAEGQTLQEIADREGVNASTVMRWLRRAPVRKRAQEQRRRIIKQLDDLLPEMLAAIQDGLDPATNDDLKLRVTTAGIGLTNLARLRTAGFGVGDEQDAPSPLACDLCGDVSADPCVHVLEAALDARRARDEQTRH